MEGGGNKERARYWIKCEQKQREYNYCHLKHGPFRYVKER